MNATYTADANGTITLAPDAKSPKGNLDVHCNGPMSRPFPGNVIVDANSFCTLDAATVNGNVPVGKDGTLAMQYSIAAGNADCDCCGSPNRSPRRCSEAFGSTTARRAGRSSAASSAGTSWSRTPTARSRSS